MPAVDWVMNSPISQEIQWTHFANELTLLSQTQQQVQVKTGSAAAAFIGINLNSHKRKIKILRRNTLSANEITIKCAALEEVQCFLYLDRNIDKKGGSETLRHELAKQRQHS
ncbi:unnamed protein product [Schistosoma curassoni]|uniref:Uncharacterized protein n=1 Tax=Schistosoma curassoni TaxID=6186 RepID=A0A183KZJ1_9TREM|nr:unnamed protein product [Schistosoma curassoni]